MKPHVVPKDFSVGARIYELAEERNIPQSFVDSCIGEFKFYFMERQIRRGEWQRSFWEWVKRGWARKKEKEAKRIKSPSFNEYQSEPIKVSSKDHISLKEMLKGG